MVRFCPPINFPNYVSNVGGSVVCKSFPCECLNMQNFVHEIETLHESMQGCRKQGAVGAHDPPEVFGRSINPILTGGHILPTTLLRAPNFQTLRRPWHPLCFHVMFQFDRLTCTLITDIGTQNMLKNNLSKF